MAVRRRELPARAAGQRPGDLPHAPWSTDDGRRRRRAEHAADTGPGTRRLDPQRGHALPPRQAPAARTTSRRDGRRATGGLDPPGTPIATSDGGSGEGRRAKVSNVGRRTTPLADARTVVTVAVRSLDDRRVLTCAQRPRTTICTSRPWSRVVGRRAWVDVRVSDAGAGGPRRAVAVDDTGCCPFVSGPVIDEL